MENNEAHLPHLLGCISNNGNVQKSSSYCVWTTFQGWIFNNCNGSWEASTWNIGWGLYPSTVKSTG